MKDFLSVEFLMKMRSCATHIKGLFEDNPELGIGLFFQKIPADV